MFEFKLPDLGEGIHEGEILKWHVAEGQTIGEDEPLVDIETDKAAVTIPSPRGGRVVRLGGAEGDTVAVGQVIAVIDDGAEAEAPAAEAEPAATPAGPAAGPGPAAPEEPAAAPAAPTPPVRPARRVAAAPATRRLARELGVDLASIPGTGPGGRITADDVRRAAAGGGPAPQAAGGPSPPPEGEPITGTTAGIPFLEIEPLPDFAQLGPVEREPVRSIRRKVARRMTTSMILVPHVALLEDCDVTELERFRREERTRREGEPGGRLSLLPFVVKAVTHCLAEFPMFNASLDPARGEIIYKKFYNVGFAADTPRGLVVPVVRGTDARSVVEISAEIIRLAEAARDGRIDAADFQGGTFTITNIGPLGGKGLIPTINYPESAILGMGRAAPQAVVRDGEIVVRTILPLTLAFDHRIADGADAARFMSRLVGLLSRPLSWLVEA